MTTEINVMKAIWKIVLVVIIGSSETVAAFDTSTHSAMTAAAAGKSRLGISPTISVQAQSLGLRDYDFVLDDKYIDIGPQVVTRIGSGFEDDILRKIRV